MSRSQQPYPAPPIVEAVVELRLKKQFNEVEIARVVKTFGSKYDRHQETGEVDVEVRIDGATVTPST